MRKIIVGASLLLASCGSQIGGTIRPKEAPLSHIIAPEETASVPVIYNFSGDFCSPCKSQAKSWVKYLGGKDSTKVKIQTFVIDLDPSEIPGYISSLKIPWFVQSDTEKLFRKYCTGINAAVPCNMIVKEGKVVYLKAAVASPQALEKYTGKWK